jgi:hypothetical protein
MRTSGGSRRCFSAEGASTGRRAALCPLLQPRMYSGLATIAESASIESWPLRGAWCKLYGARTSSGPCRAPTRERQPRKHTRRERPVANHPQCGCGVRRAGIPVRRWMDALLTSTQGLPDVGAGFDSQGPFPARRSASCRIGPAAPGSIPLSTRCVRPPAG